MTDIQTTAAQSAKKVKLEPPVHARTENPQFIDENGREFFIESVDIGYWVVKSPDPGAIPEKLSGYYTDKRWGEDAIQFYIMNTDKTGKAIINRKS